MDLGRILNETPEPAAAPAPVPTAAPVRVGKWTEEEERFSAALVKHFVAGALAIPTGTSLRSFLAKKLRCSAMRVSTKLSMDMLGSLKIPKKLGQKRFFPMEGLAEAQRAQIARELQFLEASFLQKENLSAIDCEDTADSASPAAASSASSSGSDEEADGPLRVGSWSSEEQQYACALIDAFLRGAVHVAEGTTLRAFLADRLSCNPMRISKKLATGKMANRVVPKRLGSATYRRQERLEVNAVAHTEYRLDQIRATCFSAATPRTYHPIQQQHHHAQPQLAYVLYSTPTHRLQSPMPTPTARHSPMATVGYAHPRAGALSPVHTGAKRKLPAISGGVELLARACASSRLPSAVASQCKQQRLPSVTAIAFY